MQELADKKDRIDFLDGLRGIAILLVILFHAYTRWPQYVPYGNRYAWFPLFQSGNLGVELFFLISGFVILLSIEKCSSFFSFLYKRWIRLFPAMLIATVLVFLTAPLLYERPLGSPSPASVIPGLLFIEPSWIQAVTGVKITPLEGSFWSLFAEVKFYVIFGAMYFLLNRVMAVAGLATLFIISLVLRFVDIKYGSEIVAAFSLEYFGWFAGGCLAYIYFTSKKIKYLWWSVAIAALGMVTHKGNFGTVLFCGAVLVVFYLPVCVKKTRSFFANRFLLFTGFISYPLYLIHENALIALIVKLKKMCSWFPDFFLPLIPVGILFFMAYIIAALLEPALKKMIMRMSSHTAGVSK